MRVLLLYPVFPPSFWSFEKTIELAGRKAMIPPLGLVTVAALLPPEWEFKLVDRNVRKVTEAEWAWCDMVMLSGMIVQRQDMFAQIAEAKRRGKLVAVGGPYATSMWEECRAAGPDYMVLDEGEITLPLFVAAIERGEKSGIFRSNGVKPDVTKTPVPRFDLLEMDAYSDMSVQFSRGCPFLCEFCDIIVLYGRKPRTKTAAQMIAELQALYDLGWRRSIFMVDDNFIGNKKEAARLLPAVGAFNRAHGRPFVFGTEASVDL
ncbi:MAG TPA: radical SAM protein, partial [Tepidisphaeraceae bacterium]|nr:radical SAM protein [Tepidisphaeraceae bacterium]